MVFNAVFKVCLLFVYVIHCIIANETILRLLVLTIIIIIIHSFCTNPNVHSNLVILQ